MFSRFFKTTDYPLYLWNNKKKKLLRILVDEKVEKFTKQKTKKVINKYYREVIKNFDKNLLSLYLYYHIREQIYPIVSHNEIADLINKPYKKKEVFYFQLKNIKFILKSFYKLVILLFPFKLKKNNNIENEKCDILIQYSYGNNLESKKDLPYFEKLTKLKTNIKYKYLISEPILGTGKKNLKSIKKNYINEINIPELKNKKFRISNLSKKSKKSLIYCLKKFILNPVYYSILINYIMKYEYYFNLIKEFRIKLYVQSQTYDKNIAPMREALQNTGGKNINFQRSYSSNNSTAFLEQPNEILYCWGKNIERTINKEGNFIKELIRIEPDYFKYKKKLKKIKQKKIISIFDSTIHKEGFISLDNYNYFVNLIFDHALKDKNIFIFFRFKYPSTKRFLSKKNINLLNKLKKKKQLKEFNQAYATNSKIIKSSDLVISVNSITIGAEALFNNVDSLCYCNDGFDNNLINKLNSIYDFAYKNLKDFERSFEQKMITKKNLIKIKKLKKFFFNDGINIIKPEQHILKILGYKKNKKLVT